MVYIPSNEALNPMNWLKTGWNMYPNFRRAGYIGAGGLALGLGAGVMRDDRSILGSPFRATGSMISSGLTWGAVGAAGGAAWGAVNYAYGLKQAGLTGKMGRYMVGAGAIRGAGKGAVIGALGGMAWGGIKNAFF